MNATLKKILTLVIACLMVVSLVASAVLAIGAGSFKRTIADSSDLGEIYANGRYTKNIAIDEVTVGGLAFIHGILEDRLIVLVRTTQALDAEILDYEEQIDEKKEALREYKDDFYEDYNEAQDKNQSQYNSFLASVDAKEKEIDELKKAQAEIVKELTEFHATYEPEEFDLLEEKLTDPQFLNSLGLIYLLSTGFGLATSLDDEGRGVLAEAEVLPEGDEEESETPEGDEVVEEESEIKDLALLAILAQTKDDYKTQTTSLLRVFTIIFGMLMLYAFTFLTIIFGIVLAINAIIKLIRLLVKAKNADESLLDALKTKPLVAFFATGLILFAIVKGFAGVGVVLGPAYIAMGIAFVLDCIAGMFVKLAANGVKSETAIKSAITLVSGVLAVILLITALSVCVGAITSDKLIAFEGTSYKEIYNEKFTELYNATDFDGLDATEYKNTINSLKNKAGAYAKECLPEKNAMVLISVLAGTVLTVLALVAVMCIFSRLAGRTYKTKMGDVRAYGSQMVLVCVILAITIFLSVFTVTDIDGLNGTIKSGDYKPFKSEYTVEGTYDHQLYNELTESEKLADEAITELNKQISDITDEEEKKAAVAFLDNLVRAKGCLANAKAELEETDLPYTTLIILAAVVIILEAANSFAAPKLAKLIPAPAAAPAAAEEATEEAEPEAEAEANADETNE